jgi:hypothetical protein
VALGPTYFAFRRRVKRTTRRPNGPTYGGPYGSSAAIVDAKAARFWLSFGHFFPAVADGLSGICFCCGEATPAAVIVMNFADAM